MRELLSMTIEELKALMTELGEKPFRGKQIFTWLSRGVCDFDEMTDLSKGLREKLKAMCEDGSLAVGGCSVADVQEDKQDGTRKFLFRMDGGVADGDSCDTCLGDDLRCACSADTDLRSIHFDGSDYVEGVFMKYRYGNTLCVSSQVGCKMGCVFCASALGGFVRNLTAGEMLGQVLAAEDYTGEPISHIVVMGMGEPFDNYDNLSRFLLLLHEPEGRNMSYRNMTVSTSGIVPKIDQFGADFPQVNLAISLHRLTDEGRSAIMPVNRRYPLDKLLDAAKRYTDKTHRRITFEYTLIRGENDSDADIELMIKRLGGMLCHVNLIPLNKVEETGMSGSTRRRAEQIAAALEKAGIPATVRRELGGEIDGACGQLRLKRASK